MTYNAHDVGAIHESPLRMASQQIVFPCMVSQRMVPQQIVPLRMAFQCTTCLRVVFQRTVSQQRPSLPTVSEHTIPQHAVPRHNRRSIRLKGYDYSQAGTYFVTLCTRNRECLFGGIVNGEMRLNDAGEIVAHEWIKTAEICDAIELDEWVVMPNHFHGIFILSAAVGAIHESPLHMTVTQRRNMAVPKIIGRFKMLSAKRINELRQTPGEKLWQRNYWEHVVRNEPELNRLREYIHSNPARWTWDTLYGVPCPNGIREANAEYGPEVWME